MNCPLRLGDSSATSTLTGLFSQWFEALPLEPWVVRSVSFPSCSSWFIHVQMWDRLLYQPLPCCKSSSSGCPSLPLLMVLMNVSYLTSWLLDFHTVQFSGSSGCFHFLICCCPSFGCVRSVSTYTSILAGSLPSI